MDDAQKPFVCTKNGCEMTFTNEDHLNSHRIKHDMMLNLGLSKSNEVADQTPTPTRFIRNCEEVGLFQDLQQVNPFDELFKKAAEVAKTGGTLAPEINSDDTLHTPHILPHIEVQEKRCCSNAPGRDKEQSSDFTLSHAISESVNEKTEIQSVDNDNKDVKKKIKEALRNRDKKNQNKRKNDGEDQSAGESSSNSISKKINTKYIHGESREKIREMNRVAQMRCRKRKQMKLAQMEQELEFLRDQNRKLYKENSSLKIQIAQLQQSIRIDIDKGSQEDQTGNKTTSPTSNPILIQVIPTLSGITLPMIPTLSQGNVTFQETTMGQQNKVKKKLRKLIPIVKMEKRSK